MNSTEDRLRAAAQAAANTVPPGNAPPLRLPSASAGGHARRPARGGRQRWQPGRRLAPMAAAASVLAIVAGALAIGRAAHVPPRPQPESAAARASAIASVPPFYLSLDGEQSPQAIVQATATGKVLARVTPPRPYGAFNAISGAADDRTFVLAAQRYKKIGSGDSGAAAELFDNAAPVKFFLLRLRPDGTARPLVALPGPRHERAEDVQDIALSPDGQRLAMILNARHGQAHNEIRVISLATGAGRTWFWPRAGWIGGNKPYYSQSMSWSGDGRTLAFQLHYGYEGGRLDVRLLDTTTPGGSLAATRRTIRLPGTDVFGGPGLSPTVDGNYLLTADGSTIVGPADVYRFRPAALRLSIVEISARTGKTTRVLDTWRFAGQAGRSSQQVHWTDPTGRVLILTSPPGTAPAGPPVQKTIIPVTGVLIGNQFTPLPGVPHNTDEIVW